MDKIAYNGHLETLKVLHEAGSTGCSAKAMDYAATNGFLDVVRWLHAYRLEGCSIAPSITDTSRSLRFCKRSTQRSV
ncbi:hypothetical protein SDRG_13492 [Saprolegnia diclina VS20]|uniref:Uncharacterized protein n=1 Tax=Saprolegnia diclina (strain VS20) TaxID=1156394 RepID=T0Q2M1_SAPDV|nr:hypothetical protein SDRG_13492 [Saprolegnia diclina VS20]EQC28811.1 hypothetical protein SDRG_13492 [Saprolegnia diclina VS20]|eukprot:XP_008617806.1 hypothetical protein SDRG_13492 [Saprolegnia diclina VS20]